MAFSETGNRRQFFFQVTTDISPYRSTASRPGLCADSRPFAHHVRPSVPTLEVQSRSCKWMMTVSPVSLPINFRRLAFIGSLCVPSPRAMKEPRNGWPSTTPRIFTRPRVPKNAAESGMTTYVQPPLEGDFWSFVLNRLIRGPETCHMSPTIIIPTGGRS